MEFNLKVGDIVYCYKDHIYKDILYCRKGEYYKIYNIENYTVQSCIRLVNENENIEDDMTFCMLYWILKDEKMIIKNNKVMFFYDYFLTKQQYRELKLKQLNERI